MKGCKEKVVGVIEKYLPVVGGIAIAIVVIQVRSNRNIVQ